MIVRPSSAAATHETAGGRQVSLRLADTCICPLDACFLKPTGRCVFTNLSSRLQADRIDAMTPSVFYTSHLFISAATICFPVPDCFITF